MGEVVRLPQYRNTDTMALLRALMVATVNGDVIGVEVRVRFKTGREKRASTGPFIPPPPDSTFE